MPERGPAVSRLAAARSSAAAWPAPDRLIVTCEHGGNRIPARYRALFAGREKELASHLGYDAGALRLARDMARALGAPLFEATTTRLLVDLNRSIGHPRLYSEAVRQQPRAVRQEILQGHYLPYRTAVEQAVRDATAQGARVVHVSCHSFTPVLDGETRNADVGLLYDPSRPGEAELCLRWQERLAAQSRTLRVRRNYPYAGRSDGFTTYLRRLFPAEAYVGVELEMNQKHALDDTRAWSGLRRILVRALVQAVDDVSAGGAPGSSSSH